MAISMIRSLRPRRGFSRRVGDERGQSALELAVLTPILLLLLIGVVELGYGIFSYLLVVRAGNEGARIAADGADDANTNVAAIQSLGLLASGGGLSNVDVYVIRAITDGSGNIATWNNVHTQNSGLTTTPVTSAQVQNQLHPSGAQAANMKLAVVQVFYQHHPIFGFDIGPFEQGIRMSTYTTVRDVGP